MDEDGVADQTSIRGHASSPKDNAGLEDLRVPHPSDILPYRGALRTPSSNMSLSDGYSCCQVMPFCSEEALFEDDNYLLGTIGNVYQCKSVADVPNPQQLPHDLTPNTIPTTTESDGEIALDWQAAMNNGVPVIRAPDNEPEATPSMRETPKVEPRESINRNTKFPSCPLRLIIHVNNAVNDEPPRGIPENFSEQRPSCVKCDHGSQIPETIMADDIPKAKCNHQSQCPETMPDAIPKDLSDNRGSPIPNTMPDKPKDLSKHPPCPLHVIIHVNNAENEEQAGDTREDISEPFVKCDQGSQTPDIPTTMSAPSTPKASDSSKKPSSDPQESYPIEKSPRENEFKPNLNTNGTARKGREPNESVPTYSDCRDSENYVNTGYICAGCRAEIIMCKVFEDLRKLIKVDKK